jgi:hypothetical protein
MRKVLEVVALGALVAMFAMLAMYSDLVPERIPVHFDAAGHPDRWGGKDTLWIFPAMGAVIYIGLSIMSFLRRQDVIRQLLTMVKLVTMIIFAVVSRQKLETALGNSSNFSGWLTLVMIVVMTAGLIYARKAQRES